jgi:hypothetical protein
MITVVERNKLEDYIMYLFLVSICQTYINMNIVAIRQY